MVRRAAPLLLATALGACTTVGPNYRVPDEAVVKAPEAQGAFLSTAAGTTAQALPDRWWALYDDPRLDALIEQALSANTDLRVAQANLERSLALLGERNASREIQGGVDAETTQSQRSAEAELQHVQPPRRELYNIGLSVSYDFDLFGGLKRGIEAAHADSEAAQAARDLVRVNVAAEVARAYADICNSGHQQDVLDHAIAVQYKGVALTRLTIRHGRTAPYELDRRQALLEGTSARLPRLAARQRNALFRLTALLGRLPAQADTSLLQCHTPLTIRQVIPVGDGQTLLQRRPDIRIAERHLAATTARIGVATAALYPDITFGATAGSTGALTDFLSPLTNRFGFGPGISWTLNRHAARARIEATQAQSRADLASFDGTVIKALREVETALSSYEAGLVQQQRLEQAQADAARVLQRTAQLRRGGRIAAFPALDAERDALAAEQAAAEGQAAVNDDQISLFLALGGAGARRNRRQTVIAAATCRPERTRSITPESALAEWTI
jgi:NodT family efflux transporter outer membrane factor (OMF) lipoprotein